MLEIARLNDLVVFSDEIYDRILYDDAEHVPTAALADDVLCVTFGGLSKVYRVAGFRSGCAGRRRARRVTVAVARGPPVAATRSR